MKSKATHLSLAIDRLSGVIEDQAKVIRGNEMTIRGLKDRLTTLSNREELYGETLEKKNAEIRRLETLVSVKERDIEALKAKEVTVTEMAGERAALIATNNGHVTKLDRQAQQLSKAEEVNDNHLRRIAEIESKYKRANTIHHGHSMRQDAEIDGLKRQLAAAKGQITKLKRKKS